MRILVTGAGGPAARNFIDAVMMNGNKLNAFIVGVDINEYHLAATECDSRWLINPINHPNYIQQLNHIIEKEKIEFLHAQPDVEVEFLSENREKINADMFIPNKKAIRICRDKLKTNNILKNAGVNVPKSVLFTKDTYSEISGKVKWLRAIKGAGSRAALPIDSLNLALEWRRFWCKRRELESADFMLCEFLPGREFAWQSLWKDGILQTSMARERKEYLFGNIMPSGQSSSPSIAKSLHWDKLNVLGVDAVKAVDEKPHGIYCIDIKENIYGEPCITEINAGRFFTTSNFFANIGSNMPQQYLKMAYGESFENDPLLMFNAADSGIYWIRGVDTKPRSFNYEQIQFRIRKPF